jgi:hypothetical protein
MTTPPLHSSSKASQRSMDLLSSIDVTSLNLLDQVSFDSIQSRGLDTLVSLFEACGDFKSFAESAVELRTSKGDAITLFSHFDRLLKPVPKDQEVNGKRKSIPTNSSSSTKVSLQNSRGSSPSLSQSSTTASISTLLSVIPSSSSQNSNSNIRNQNFNSTLSNQSQLDSMNELEFQSNKQW